MNTVYLKGRVLFDPKHGRSNGGVAWAIFSVKPDGGKSGVDCKAFRELAETVATLGQGDEVKVTAHIEGEKPRDGGKKWLTAIVADKVEVVGGRGGRTHGGPPPDDDPLPF